MKKILFLAFAAMAVITTVGCSKEDEDEAYIIPEGYVDLGLSSGTLWKIAGENNGESPFFTYNQAVQKFGSELPTKEQYEELTRYCQWTIDEDGNYVATGKNGNSITIYANGYLDNGVIKDEKNAYYWTSTMSDQDLPYHFLFQVERYFGMYGGLYEIEPEMGMQVRLVTKKKK